MRLVKKIAVFLPGLTAGVLPKPIARYLSPERYSIDHFVWKTVVPNIKETDLLLDAGAGFGRYRKELSKARYVATDFIKIFETKSIESMDFVCSLDAIPKPDNTYDVIVNTQVLEHVEYPDKVIKEFYRVLKPNGKLYLTTNQTWMVHGAPYNFYFYTKFGLESLFRDAGFKIDLIEPRGGMFWVLVAFLNMLPQYVYYQLCYESFKQTAFKKPKLVHPMRAVVLYPIYLLLQNAIVPVTLVLFFMDRFDRQKDATLGYSCVCTKVV